MNGSDTLTMNSDTILRRKHPALPAWPAWTWGLLLGAAFAVLVLSRKPDVLLHAELWGDDG